ncbi:MAG: hypothetical protein P4L27_10700 [Ignavibacteriaceae bacterium]|nr:hypothetical protein [Ignavibacteriaceae bacterium]
MKYYFLVPILAAFILVGCAKENTIMGPPTQQQTQAKSTWIKTSTTASIAVENSYTASKTIDGSKGGSIALSQAFRNNGNWALVTAYLSIPKGAFSGTKVISYTVNTDDASIDFSPSPTSFLKNLSLDLTFKGINLSGYRNSQLCFAYLDGSNIVPVTSGQVYVNTRQGLLTITGAQISHFSRYGWSNIDNP